MNIDIQPVGIDKANSSELSEAINSMYQWYEKSGVCYACLADVKSEQDFLVSRWWTRAWTLQELLAPSIVIFYDAFYLEMGTKATMSGKIAIATGIDELTLQNPRAMFLTSVARRMSWAAHRLASRSEDIAYSLLGRQTQLICPAHFANPHALTRNLRDQYAHAIRRGRKGIRTTPTGDHEDDQGSFLVRMGLLCITA